MPDTHLVMPRTLSAPYAELLEAEASRTTTASDAPSNGTAAAAAAFARLLASGDHAMQPEPSPITETPAASALACNAAHRQYDLRAMLMGSTILPALGMTIAEASQKTADLLSENDGPGPLTDEQADALATQWTVLENAVIGAMPHTILDAASILDRIFPDDATHIPQRDIPVVRRVATFLHQVAETTRSASPDETSIIPSIGMNFRQAADRVRELLERGNTILKDDPEDDTALERVEAERTADCREWIRIENAMMSTPARTIGDVLAKLERVVCPDIGVRAMVPSDAEIIMLEEDVKRLQSQWGGIGPSTVGEAPPDAEILELARRREAILQAMDGEEGISDERVNALGAQWLDLDRQIMALSPKTGAGIAVQLSVAWRDMVLMPGEEGGPTPESHRSMVWLWTAMKNAERLGRQDKDEMPQDTIASLYARWVEVRAHYLDEGLSEEEHEAAEAALDEIEDRLELEPVRHVDDAVVKLGYFLTRSNQLLDEELLPAIDANSSVPWPRLLFLIEDGAARLPANLQEPFRAMATGLRQLMQRHVKLAEEAERRAGAYQLPEQVSQAMQAALERVRAVNATKRGSGTGGDTAVEREFIARAEAIAPERWRVIFGLMEFIVVSAHLDDAMQRYAQEHGLVPQYREWLERNLADAIKAQGGIEASEQLRQKADDAELLQAFEDWRQASIIMANLPGDMSDKDRDPYWESVRGSARRMRERPARTPAGIAVKLRYLFASFGELTDFYEVILYGRHPGEEELVDFRHGMLWDLIVEAERMAASANDQQQDVDAFADTVAAFEAEAPGTLALPQEPTGRMVDAGASAAGITPEQFQAAYAAAVEALKLERAA